MPDFLLCISFYVEEMIIEQPPAIFRKLYPGALWRIPRERKTVYLTFDDGPVPLVTEWVVKLLADYGIKATFFLVGDNIRKHRDVFELLLESGHVIGNHTYNHLQGFRYSAEDYLANVDKAGAFIANNLFRPPHGHLTLKQYRLLRQRYRIVMWDLVTRDYSKRMDGKRVFDNVVRYARNGSIITFHDSYKAEKNMKYALPRAVDWLLEQGYAFDVL